MSGNFIVLVNIGNDIACCTLLLSHYRLVVGKNSSSWHFIIVFINKIKSTFNKRYTLLFTKQNDMNKYIIIWCDLGQH